jgi:hypothetical protein
MCVTSLKLLEEAASSSRSGKSPAKSAKMSDSPLKMPVAVMERLMKEASSRRCDVVLTNVANSKDPAVTKTYVAAKEAYEKFLRRKMLHLFPEDDRDRVEAMIADEVKVQQQATDGQQVGIRHLQSQMNSRALMVHFFHLAFSSKHDYFRLD